MARLARMCFQTFVTLLLALGFMKAAGAEPLPWKLVWADEFDGPKLDYSKWAGAFESGMNTVIHGPVIGAGLKF